MKYITYAKPKKIQNEKSQLDLYDEMASLWAFKAEKQSKRTMKVFQNWP